MGKIVKYCNSCEEGFAEKFGFCPNCGKQLQAFEMVPQIGETYIPQSRKVSAEPPIPVQEAKTENFEIKEEIGAVPPVTVPPIAALPVIEDKVVSEPDLNFTEQISYPEPVIEAVKDEKLSSNTSAAERSAESYYQATYPQINKSSAKSDGFYVTVIEEKNVGQRNALLLGTLVIFCGILLGGVVFSIFNKQLGVGAIDQGDLIAFVPEVEPVPVEAEPPPKKDKDKGGGGGGGGKEEQEQVQKGRLANQEEKPMIAPSKTITQVTNPELKFQAATEGKIKRPITSEQYGLPNGLGVNSDGSGRGGGMGSGDGRGMGSGRGTGEGSGIGSGSGGGRGDGIGDGTGPGTGGGPPPPPPATKPRPAVTTSMKIISKPRADYTDAARQNNVQGTVTLKVTFLASGQIGSISPVSGLPYGLTEKAIAAARSIRFEPQMVDGVAKTVTKTVQYSFTIF